MSSDILEIYILALLGTKSDLNHYLCGNNNDCVTSENDLTERHKDALDTLKAQPMPETDQIFNQRIGMTLSFIMATPFVFTQEAN